MPLIPGANTGRSVLAETVLSNPDTARVTPIVIHGKPAIRARTSAGQKADIVEVTLIVVLGSYAMQEAIPVN